MKFLAAKHGELCTMLQKRLMRTKLSTEFSDPELSGILEGRGSDSGRVKGDGIAAQFQRTEQS